MKNIVDSKIGKDVKIWDNVDFFKCEIGDGTKIKSFVVIEEGVKIGKNCKIGPFVYIPEGIEIEDNVFVGAFTTFTNDKYPRAANPDGSIKTAKDWECQKTLVKKGTSIGVGSIILPGITIGEGAFIAAGAVVTKDIQPFKLVRGIPAVVVGSALEIK